MNVRACVYVHVNETDDLEHTRMQAPAHEHLSHHARPPTNTHEHVHAHHTMTIPNTCKRIRRKGMQTGVEILLIRKFLHWVPLTLQHTHSEALVPSYTCTSRQPQPCMYSGVHIHPCHPHAWELIRAPRVGCLCRGSIGKKRISRGQTRHFWEK